VKLVVQENLVPGDDLLARSQLARSAGFDGLELRDTGTGRVAAMEAARRAGAWMPTVCPELPGFIGDFDAERREVALAHLEDQLDGLARAGGESMITPAAWGMFSRRLPPFTPPRSEAEDREVLLESLARLGRRADARGVRVLLEPLNRYEDHMVNTLAQAAALCTEVAMPSVGLLADTYHMNIEEDDLCAALRGAAPWLGEVHVSDSNRHQPGTGHVPFAAVLATLRELGFDGVLGLECRLRGDAEPALRACAAHLRGVAGA
jgi:sugar phosphate isomerase/epimerase